MDDADCRAWLAGAVATAGVDGERAMCEVDTAGQGLVLTVFVGFGDEERLAALLPGRSTAVVEAGGSASAAEQSPAEIAESVLNALEERAGLELVPSMPTPEELESVYEWDRRLAARVESEAVTPAAGTAA
jgi:hypothetical protein